MRDKATTKAPRFHVSRIISIFFSVVVCYGNGYTNVPLHRYSTATATATTTSAILARKLLFLCCELRTRTDATDYTYTNPTTAAHDEHQQQQQQNHKNLSQATLLLNRRNFGTNIVLGCCSTVSVLPEKSTAATATATTPMRDFLIAVKDPNTYSALSYVDPRLTEAAAVAAAGAATTTTSVSTQKIPLLVVLHGAGKNIENVWNLANPQGEHGGLIPSLIATNRAPQTLVDHFAIVVPYSQGRTSFYDEPRSKLLNFIDWVTSDEGIKAGCPSNIDPDHIFLFGFSDGATVAVELATTRRFTGVIICAYGYSGILPDLALQRLSNIPFWVFHSADDVIFPVRYSDQLVKSLRSVTDSGLVRYTRYDQDQEGFTGDVRGHSVGITASKMEDIYTWMLSLD